MAIVTPPTRFPFGASDLRAKLIFIWLLVLAPVCAAPAGRPVEYVFPQTPFDAAQAARLLDDTGKATIRGKVLFKGKPLGNALQVSLYPMTDHLIDYLALDKKLGSRGRKQASITNEATSYRLVTKVKLDDPGAFEFTHVKPGKYYLEAYYVRLSEHHGSSYVGQDSVTFEGSLISGPPIFKSFTYHTTSGHFMRGLVEVKYDGESVSAVIEGQ